MSGYVQIQGDPTQWWLAVPVQPGQLTGKTLSVQVQAPLAGTLLISPKAANVAFGTGTEPTALDATAPAIYVPTATGPAAGSAGYELPASADLTTLAGQITTLMDKGSSQTIALAASGATLALDGATLSFVVLCPATAAGLGQAPVGSEGIPHDAPPA